MSQTKQRLVERDLLNIWHPYTQMKTAPPPLPVVKGTKEWLILEDGTELIDAISSWWVNIHGHSHPHIAQKIAEQALELEHVIFAGFTHPPAVTLAERLMPHLPNTMSRVFFSDNGSTAVEIAIKMAIQYFYNQDKPKQRLIAFDQAFHGETFGAMAATGHLSFNNAFENQLFEVDRIPVPVKGKEKESLDALEKLLKEKAHYAFIFEPLILGAGGMIMYTPEILDKLIALCKKYEVLTIADEVMTGFFRTGRLLACNYLQYQPDLICLAKGLTGGTLPLSLTVCNDHIFQAFYSDDKQKTLFHGHSFTANPLGCAAALASLDLVEAPEFQVNLQELVNDQHSFCEAIKAHPTIVEARHRGTIVAIEIRTEGKTSYFNNLRDWLYNTFLDKGIILRPLGNVIYFMPPYCISKASREKVYQAIREVLNELHSKAT